MKFKLIPLLLSFLICSNVWGAVDADGADDCMNTASAVTFGTNIITVSFWANFANTTDANQLLIELSANYNNTDNAFLFNWSANNPSTCDSNSFSASIQSSSTINLYRVECLAAQPSTGVWHHYSVVYDNSTSNGDVKLYVDGSEQSLNIETNTKDQSGNFAADTIYFFDRACAGGGSLDAVVKMDEVYIHSGELSATEVSLLYNSRTRKIGQQVDNTLIAYWPLDECADGTDCTGAGLYKDRSSNTNNITPSSTAGQIPTGSAGAVLTYP